MHESISVIDSVEILPLEQTEVNPYLTRVRIKVFHLGENRNHSYIDKETARKMAKTLRGNPIVARYREEKQDFTDHGTEIVINDKGVSQKVLTRPYGFVDLNAEVWFEDFLDTDDLGNQIRHTYLVTEGLIWNELYEELQNTIMAGGRPQSMELDEKTLQGSWSKMINSHCEIFIINDAIITKLCALGEDTEPCFLGASITPLFTEHEEDSFVKELIELKHKFHFALNNGKGGTPMNDEVQNVVKNDSTSTEFEAAAAEVEKKEEKATEAPVEENETSFKKKEDEKEEEDSKECPAQDNADSNAEEEDDEEKKKAKKNFENSQDENVESDSKISEDKVEDNTNFALVEELNNLKTEFEALKAENESLKAFKQEVEMKEKDALIDSFYMLSDEDKKNVIENKATYSLKDIKAELSMICVDKKVSFSKEESKVDEAPVTFNLNASNMTGSNDLPSWLAAVEAVKNSKN